MVETERGHGPDDTGISTVREPMFNIPPGVLGLVGALCAVQGVRSFLTEAQDQHVLVTGALIPLRFHLAPFAPETLVTLVTYQFLHGGWLHLGLNVLMLLALGTAMSAMLGTKRMLALFLVSGVAGGLTHLFLAGDPSDMVVGASGGISGLFGGVLWLLQAQMHGRNQWRRLLRLVVLMAISMAVLGSLGLPGSAVRVAWVDHLGGLAAGLVLYPLLRRGWMRRQS